MVKDYLTIKNACLEQIIGNDYMRSISVKTSGSSRIYSVWFVAYYKVIEGVRYPCHMDDRFAQSNKFYKEFNSFSKAESCYNNFRMSNLVGQRQEYVYLPL